ncbi:MAG: peptidoglycan editing factor PgeF [Actinomycetota bacterium]|nr:peptidoglycan editing factor PgeF [Actinomycetota bacterium]
MPAIFTDRRGGSSLAPYESFNLALHVGDDPVRVLDNRASLSKLSPPVVFMNQLHGDLITVVNDQRDGAPTCDALVTNTPGLAVAVLVADCIPLLLSSSTVVAAVHVGRKGLVNSIALKAVEQMRRLGASSIHAQLGPSICGACYEIPEAMADEVVRTHPNAFALTRLGTPALDLPKALIADLVSQGITYEASAICTLEDNNYFSFRRHNITGRSAGVIWL